VAPNGAKTEQITLHVTLFLNLHKKLAAPYRNTTAKFKIRTWPFKHGHPCYQSRPESVTLSVANSKKKERSQNTLHSLQKLLWAPYSNATAKFNIRSRPFWCGHPRYQSRPESVTLSVANSQKKRNRPTSCTQRRVAPKQDRVAVIQTAGFQDWTQAGGMQACSLLDSVKLFQFFLSRLILPQKLRIQHTKSQMGVAHDPNLFPQCFRCVCHCFENEKFAKKLVTWRNKLPA